MPRLLRLLTDSRRWLSVLFIARRRSTALSFLNRRVEIVPIEHGSSLSLLNHVSLQLLPHRQVIFRGLPLLWLGMIAPLLQAKEHTSANATK